jgi:hypothetical protein
LRNLKSFGVFPVSKPYLKFDLKSVRRPDDTKSTKKGILKIMIIHN